MATQVVTFPCIYCKKAVTKRHHGIQCERCELWQHRLCKTGVSFAEYRLAVTEKKDIIWVCEPCTTNVTTRRKPPATNNNETPSKRQRTHQYRSIIVHL